MSADLSQQRTELPPQYVPGEVEDRLYQSWESRGLMHAEAKDVSPEHPAFCVVIPPPNVTGSLHIGHALNHTLIDALVRRRRMQGYTALWVPGMDHAGIATQNVVERELAKEGLSRHDLGREAFVDRVWQWKAESGGKILGQMRRLGDSVNWSRERFTMDEGLSRAVQTVFKRLFDDKLIYRAERIINWCPRCLTALSDIEVDHSDEDGELVSIRYGDGDDSVVVATTRAETMLGDTGIAVHPDDPRYARLVGREVQLPLSGRRIPVVADPHVDPDFGTGAVKVTPAHDPDDFEIGRRHGLPSITILDEHGRVTAHGPFEGLDRFEARPAVVAALREDGRIVAEVRPYVHAVGHCSRCGTVVEPRLSLQWFVKVGPLAKAAGDAVRDGRVGIHPAELAPRYFDWVNDMHDWCISRQLWWGHRIPVWYGPSGEVVCVGPGEDPPSGHGWRQDPDVLDTWFSSALWPCSTLGWPGDTEDLAVFYPTSVLVTAYDILFFWVARMMMFGLYVMSGREPAQAVPFRDIALHGLVRDQHGKKMSKSLGNTVDPLDWIGRFGADATRFTLARGASPGSDVAVSEEWVTGSRNFCNKLWNATRFALLNGATVPQELPDPGQMPTAARWILSRLAAVTDEADGLFERYEFGKVCDLLYHFAWDEVCDWYLELAKPALSGPPPRRRLGQHRRSRLLGKHGGDGPGHPRGARPRPGPAAEAAPPGHAVRHRGAVDRAHRGWQHHDRSLAGPAPGGPQRRAGGLPGRRRGSGDQLADAAGHRGPPVPFRPGAAARAAGPCRAGRDRGHPPCAARGQHPLPAAADRARRQLRGDRVRSGRGHHRGTGHRRRDRRGRRAPPPGQGPGRRPQGGGPGRAEAGQRVVPGQSARRRGGQDPGAARRRAR